MNTRGLLRSGLGVALALLLLGAVGCGGTEAPPGGEMTEGDMAGAPAGSLALFAACTTNVECMSGLCTMESYDRSPTPICTYMCDANDTNPNCPMGCNPKGFCKKPN
jgi:hypothetical protein